MALPTDYAWAAGFNAADGSLVTIANDLAPYTLPALGTYLSPKSGLVDTFPIRSQTLDGSQRGDGIIYGSLNFAAMPVTAFRYILSTYFSSGTVVSVPMTVVLAQYSIAAIWQKWNCYMVLPQPFKPYVYDSNFMLNVTIQLSDLILLS